MHGKLGPHYWESGSYPNGKDVSSVFLKDLRESVDNQYPQNKCETVERLVTSRIWFQWSSQAVSHDSEEWDSSSDSTSETGELEQCSSTVAFSFLSFFFPVSVIRACILHQQRLSENLCVCRLNITYRWHQRQNIKYSGLQFQHPGQLFGVFFLFLKLTVCLEMCCVLQLKSLKAPTTRLDKAVHVINL